ncbi:MAG TPA: Flp pilus assembly protein CpaB [Candidatus Limnocylindrales bacterium]
MQAQSTRDRRRRRLLVVLGLALAVIAAIATYYAATRSNTGPAPTPTPVAKTVVVAAVDILARSEITPAMLTTVQVPDGPAYASAITDPTVALGQIALVRIPAGEVVRTNLFGAATGAGIDILPPGATIAPDSPIWRAVSVEVPRDRAVAGLIEPGDWIDLFVTVEIGEGVLPGAIPGASPDAALLPGAYVPGMATKITWVNVQVLSVITELNLYVMRVTERQAEEIAHIQASGENSFTISLRPAGDNRDVDTADLGQTQMVIVDRYGIPIPQVLSLPTNGPLPSPTESPSPNP